MRIAIDLQACQAANKRQGIGRSSLEFTRALLRNHGGHEILVATNANFPSDADRIRSELADVAEKDQFVSWRTHEPIDFRSTGGTADFRNALLARNQFFASLGADLVHCPSLFEGYGDNAVTAIDRRSERRHIESVTLHDLIPLVHESIYLADPQVRQWYSSKLELLKRADLLLAVSESSRLEGLRHLGFAEDTVVAVSSGVGQAFHPVRLDADAKVRIRAKYGIRQRFVMYSGGIDVRKNIERLVQAYGALPAATRANCQLAIVCRITDDDRARFTAIGALHGLAPADMVFTGYVPDSDLVSLYSLCDAFVFPSWHEGFGLPVLEAMACGAPVITSDRSSLPEVMGRKDALFDPYSVESIETLMRRVLEDGSFSDSLRRHGVEHARRFSWDSTATAARAAFEAVCDDARRRSPAESQSRRKTLAYVSPLPPEQSGISDYSAELLPALGKHYDLVAISPEAPPVQEADATAIPVRNVDWFHRNVHEFDRIVYQFGNSTFHSHMFELLAEHPGVVVLHDFFLSGIVAHLDHTGVRRGMWAEYLYRSHGYRALVDLATAADSAAPIWKYPANLPVLQQALGTIVHSRYSMGLASHWYGCAVADGFRRVPQLRRAIDATTAAQREAIRKRLGVASDAILVCSFGLLGRSKRNEALLEAWRASGLADRSDARLVFVGEAPGDAYGSEIAEGVAALGGRATITGFVDAQTYHDYLAIADVAVQLRSMSRGETSRAVLDCMAAGLPLIVNANGSMGELPVGTAEVIPDEFTTTDLSAALRRLQADHVRAEMSGQQRAHVERELAPAVIAQSYRDTIEAFYASPLNQSLHGLASQLSSEQDFGGTVMERARLAEAVSYNTHIAPAPPQLLVDVSELIKHDARSGIQRVVHGVLKELFAQADGLRRVEPVYTIGDGVYRYARSFTSRYLDLTVDLPDEIVDFAAGDVFLGLDLAPIEVHAAETALQRMRQAGVGVYFIVYDVLPLQRPDCFPPEASGIFKPWTQTVGRCASGVICISRTVASDVHEAIDVLEVERYAELPIWSFPLGLSLHNGVTDTTTEEVVQALSGLGEGPVVIMVGTIEPRKGYSQALAAFDELWRRGHDTQLVIVGKQGWMTESVVHAIDGHPERGRKLHWFKCASDALLNALYERAAVLLCASEGEGFGLPLLEAYSRGLPVIARDIPVFREVGGERPTYFSGFEAADLADAIELFQASGEGKTPRPGKHQVPCNTWASAVEVLHRIFDGTEPVARLWLPGERRVLWASDAHMHSDVGEKRRGRLESTGRAGVLARATDIRLSPGTYALTLDYDIKGTPGEGTFVEIVGDNALPALFHMPLSLTTSGMAAGVFEVSGGTIEVRICVAEGDNLSIRKIMLTEQIPGRIERHDDADDELGLAAKAGR